MLFCTLQYLEQNGEQILTKVSTHIVFKNIGFLMYTNHNLTAVNTGIFSEIWPFISKLREQTQTLKIFKVNQFWFSVCWPTNIQGSIQDAFLLYCRTQHHFPSSFDYQILEVKAWANTTEALINTRKLSPSTKVFHPLSQPIYCSH